ncbi:hypothetical protein L1049_014329 [Liquidambar formosana]|uniref:WAT1-related protein n=1 Tax=Liquidambar formosana TaxID=63359 RepID=A0AAP0RN45_LIQFO
MKWNGQWKPVVAMVAVNFALAMVNVLLKKILNEGRTNHLVIVTYRQSVSTIFLTPIAYFWDRYQLLIVHSPFLEIAFYARATLTQYLFLLGLQYTSATFSSAFINLVPASTFIIALPFGLEKVNVKSKGGRTKVLGTMVCIGGAMLLTLYKGIPLTNPSHSQAGIHKTNADMVPLAKKTENWATGSIVLTAGSLTWSSWFLIQARIGKRYPCQYSSTTIMSFFSAIQSALLSLIIERDFSKWALKGKLEISSIIYAGMVGSGLCYVGMSWCIKQRGPVFTSAFSPLIQIFVATFDFFIQHEQIHLGSVLGSILLIAGLYILLWGKSKEAEDCVTKQTLVDDENEDCIPVSDPVTNNSRCS